MKKTEIAKKSIELKTDDNEIMINCEIADNEITNLSIALQPNNMNNLDYLTNLRDAINQLLDEVAT
jgi:hypothetical protein